MTRFSKVSIALSPKQAGVIIARPEEQVFFKWIKTHYSFLHQVLQLHSIETSGAVCFQLALYSAGLAGSNHQSIAVIDRTCCQHTCELIDAGVITIDR